MKARKAGSKNCELFGGEIKHYYFPLNKTIWEKDLNSGASVGIKKVLA